MSPRSRRLQAEWEEIVRTLSHRTDLSVTVSDRNAEGVPCGYRVNYHIRTFCGVEHSESIGDPDVINPPCFADRFTMDITIPHDYPSIDATPEFRFLTHDAEGHALPHPWHPNIRYGGEMAGRVCLNTPDTYTSLAWCIDRVARYLTFDRYHATSTPPFPEDLTVARWIIRQAEPCGWIPPSR